MKLSDIGHNQILRFRIGVHTDGDSPNWEPWKSDHFFVTRREKEFRRGKNVYPSGEITTIAPISDPRDLSFSQASYCGDGIFNLGRFLMEIEGIED